MARLSGLSVNLNAFLDMTAHSELGNLMLNPLSDDGYKVLVGGGLFDSYADHPRVKVFIARLGVSSTAAGRYQILARYYDSYKLQLGLTDFSPESQDRIAVQMIKEVGATHLIEAGNITSAIQACSSRWASFPGSPYGQGENPMEGLLAVFRTYSGATNQEDAQ